MATKEKLNICVASAEFAPIAKTGGLADVVAALSSYLHRAGHDVRVLMPRYARLETQDLQIAPVAWLQGLSMRIGPWKITYSIDITLPPGSDVPIYLLRCPELYQRDGIYTQDGDEHLRFILLSRAAIEMCQRMNFAPDIFHSHDWHTALIPMYLRTLYAWDARFRNTKTVHTIHNIGYQGVFAKDILPDLNLNGASKYLYQEDLKAGNINFMKTGVLYAHVLTTVSPTYAREIQTPQYGMQLDELLRARSDRLLGILNGVDYAEWNPQTDNLIPANYSINDLSGKSVCKQELMKDLGLAGSVRQPLIGIVTRLVSQKGIELIEQVIPHLLTRRNFSLAILGSGESRYEEFFTRLQNAMRNRVCFYRGYNNKLAHWIEAGSDLFLMPSLYEPCGLNQMYSLKYGTVPIVRATGGLADSVQQVNPYSGRGTGIVFSDYDAAGLGWGIEAGLNLYANKRLMRRVMYNGMLQNYSWDRQGAIYVELFRKLRMLK